MVSDGSARRRLNCRIKPFFCSYRQNIRTGTFFARAHLTLYQIVEFAILWVDNVQLRIVEKHVEISHKIAVDWANFCREVVYDSMIMYSEKLGGEGKVVEIDESKFGRRKYNKGHHVEGQWVFGGFERKSGKIFMVPVEKRDRLTLFEYIKQWILPGTTIMSNCWTAYNCLNDEGYIHYKVNHKLNFFNKQTGAHTNPIESWRHAKVQMPAYKRHKPFFVGYLAKYMLKKNVASTGVDPTIAFFKAVGIFNNRTGGDDNDNKEEMEPGSASESEI